jgi:hypothetical protein
MHKQGIEQTQHKSAAAVAAVAATAVTAAAAAAAMFSRCAC